MPTSELRVCPLPLLQARRRTLGDKIELQSYVIAPVQRFTKYKLLLRVRP